MNDPVPPILACIQCGGTHCYPVGHAREIERLRGVMEIALGSGSWDRAQAILAEELETLRAYEADRSPPMVEIKELRFRLNDEHRRPDDDD